MDAHDWDYASAVDLVAALAARAVSAVELTERAIARIERHDGRINAMCVRDFDRALAAAREADAALTRGERRPLLGVPMTIKESFNIAGLPTTWGIPACKDYVPGEDALAVARVKAAGAVILGKTNVPFALADWQSDNEIYGTTNNPWDPGRTPGGSSGGSSAALAAGYGALSLGSDIGGSLRAPAHYCGVYAHKPSSALAPPRGHTPPGMPPLASVPDLAVIGPMARSAADLTLAFQVIAPPDELGFGIAHRLALPAPRHGELKDFRVLVLDTHPLLPSSAEVREAVEDLAGRLAAAGVTVARTHPMLPDLADASRLYMRLLFSFIAVGWPPERHAQTAARVATLDPADISLTAESQRGAVMSHRDFVLADGGRLRLRHRWLELFKAFDVVITPVMPTTAFPHERRAEEERRITIDGSEHPYADQFFWAGVATLPGLPATAVPIARSAAGLPIGVQIIGPYLEDLTPLRFAELIEREFGGFTPPPGFA
jgi:amidase